MRITRPFVIVDGVRLKAMSVLHHQLDGLLVVARGDESRIQSGARPFASVDRDQLHAGPEARFESRATHDDIAELSTLMFDPVPDLVSAVRHLDDTFRGLT